MQRYEYEHLQYDELERIARNDIVFPLACFLIGAGEYAYFCYSWGYRDTDGGVGMMSLISLWESHCQRQKMQDGFILENMNTQMFGLI